MTDIYDVDREDWLAVDLSEDQGLEWDELSDREKDLLRGWSNVRRDVREEERMLYARDIASLARQLSTAVFQLRRVERVRDNIAPTHPEVAEMIDKALTGTWFKKTGETEK